VSSCLPGALTTGGDQSVEDLRRELAEAREQQTATAEILRVISSSPMDVERVFAEIAASAARLCDAYDASIFQMGGDFLRLAAHHGPIPAIPMGRDTLPLAHGVLTARAALDRRTIHIADLQTDTDEYPETSKLARLLGFRTIAAVPLIRAGAAIGVITLRRTEARLFSDKQIALLETFADQAVIAIENSRLFEEVQARTRELTDSLEQQTAMSEVLGVISSSPAHVQPVLDAIVKTAATLCNSYDAVILLKGTDDLSVAAHHGPMALDFERLPLRRDTVAGRTILDGAPVHVHDLAAQSKSIEYPLGQQIAARLNQRTVLGLPLLREGQTIGCLFLRRTELLPFSERQISLLQTFADQAVIAIENTRLFEAEQASKRELLESLEYQTATSDVLGVISRSPNEVQPVLDTIAQTAQRLCHAEHAFVLRLDMGLYRLVAANDAASDWVNALKANPLPADRGSVTGRVALERRTVHVTDLRDDPDYTLRATLQRGVRSELGVPLLRDGEVIGVIIVGRTEVRPFTQRQIELIETFADQAVIAIENVRLFEAEQASKRELQESLQQQIATADVLKVMRV